MDSEILAHEVETEVLDSIGLHYDRHEFTARFMGMSDSAFFAALDADGQARLGRSIIDEIRGPMNDKLRKAVAERLTEVPGALRVVSSVRHAKAVASSSTERHLGIKLRKTGLWDHFAPHVFSAEHVTHAKPAPDLFLLAANALGVAPDRLSGHRGQRERRARGARSRHARLGLWRRRPYDRTSDGTPRRSRRRTHRRSSTQAEALFAAL